METFGVFSGTVIVQKQIKMTARNFSGLPSDLYRPRQQETKRTHSCLPMAAISVPPKRETPRPMPPNKQASRRRVTFCEEVRVATMPHVNDFSQREVNALWFSRLEFEQSRADCLELVLRMDEQSQSSQEDSPTEKARRSSCHLPLNQQLHNTPSSSLNSFRGLEGLFKEQHAKRRIRRAAASDAVMWEQSYQWEQGVDDPEFIRRLYLNISTLCLDEARLRAIQDEEEARWGLSQLCGW